MRKGGQHILLVGPSRIREVVRPVGRGGPGEPWSFHTLPLVRFGLYFPEKHYRAHMGPAPLASDAGKKKDKGPASEDEKRAARIRAGELKEEMATRVRSFVEQRGHRPLLKDIEGDEEWRQCYSELQQVRHKFGREISEDERSGGPGDLLDEHGTHRNVDLEFPDRLPDVPAALASFAERPPRPEVREAILKAPGRDFIAGAVEEPTTTQDASQSRDGATMPLALALHLCFPDAFPTMTASRKSLRRGGNPKVYLIPPEETARLDGDGRSGCIEDSEESQVGVAGTRSGPPPMTCRDVAR